jgi:cytochrome c553
MDLSKTDIRTLAKYIAAARELAASGLVPQLEADVKAAGQKVKDGFVSKANGTAYTDDEIAELADADDAAFDAVIARETL